MIHTKPTCGASGRNSSTQYLNHWVSHSAFKNGIAKPTFTFWPWIFAPSAMLNWPPTDTAIDAMTDEQWRTTAAVNLDSAFALVKHAVAQMKLQERGGHIVMVSSTAAQRGEAGHCDYAATKGALISMVKGLSTELAPFGIYVNCVAPGWVGTDMSADALQDPQRRMLIHATIPLGRVGKPEEIAAPILFLCTPYAGFITGEVFNVNGGAVLVG